MHRICVVTAGHLATCPRMLKAADALAEAGCQVRVVSTHFLDWAAQADQDVVRRRPASWQWTAVDYSRDGAARAAAWSSLRQRAATRISRWTGASACPFAVAARATVRVHPELVRAVLAEPCDLVYAGGGATAVAAAASRRGGMPFAVDLEDYHGAQSEDDAGRWQDRLNLALERRTLPHAAFLTAGSEPIAGQYRQTHAVSPITIHNVFPLPDEEPPIELSRDTGLRLYWFSQTIGPGRGLEDAIRAMGIAGISGQLVLKGRVRPGYGDALMRLAREAAPRLTLLLEPPSPPDTMVEAARNHDVGLSLEQPVVLNRDLCQTNKAFTYMLAGLAVVFSDTRGQRALARDMGDAAVICRAGDIPALAAELRRWWEQPEQLLSARRRAWAAARRRWHWEHPLERGRLLDAVTSILPARP